MFFGKIYGTEQKYKNDNHQTEVTKGGGDIGSFAPIVYNNIIELFSTFVNFI